MSITLTVSSPHKGTKEAVMIDPGNRVWDTKTMLIDKIDGSDMNFGLLMIENESESAHFLDDSMTFAVAGIISDVIVIVSLTRRSRWNLSIKGGWNGQKTINHGKLIKTSRRISN